MLSLRWLRHLKMFKKNDEKFGGLGTGNLSVAIAVELLEDIHLRERQSVLGRRGRSFFLPLRPGVYFFEGKEHLCRAYT